MTANNFAQPASLAGASKRPAAGDCAAANLPDGAYERAQQASDVRSSCVAVNAKGFRSGLMSRPCLVELQATATKSGRGDPAEFRAGSGGSVVPRLA